MGSQFTSPVQVFESTVILLLLEENPGKFITSLSVGLETMISPGQFKPEIKISEGSAQPVSPGKNQRQEEINVASLFPVIFTPGRVTSQYAVLIALVKVTHLQIDVCYITQVNGYGLACTQYLL